MNIRLLGSVARGSAVAGQSDIDFMGILIAELPEGVGTALQNRAYSLLARHVAYAKNTLAKDRRVNIRISSKDLEQLQVIAVEDGMPYQTLMASVLHRFVNGRFVKTSSRTKKSRLPHVPLGT